MNYTGISFTMGLLKALVYLYDVLSFVPYCLIYKPAKVLAYSKRQKAVQVDSDPDSPYRSTEVKGELTTTLFTECVTLDDLFQRAVQLYGPHDCLGTREVLKEEDVMQGNGKVFKKLILGDYSWQSFNEVNERVMNFGRGLQALGQKPRKNILLFAETRAEWVITAETCLKYNFPIVTLYATLNDEAVIHGINESEVTHVITSADLLPKFKNILSQVPNVTHVIFMNYNSVSVTDFPKGIDIISMTDVEELGSLPANSNITVEKPTRADIAVIMYTSGSTGLPKGVLISHGNLMCGMSGQCERIAGLGPGDTYIGYLPLAHVLELTCELSCVAHGSRIGYSSPNTLSDQSSKIMKGHKGDASVLKPTLMAAVPVIMDRISKGVWDKVSEGGEFSKAIFKFAYEYKLRKFEKGHDTPIMNRLLFQKIRNLMGGRIRLMLCGGAPLSSATQRFINLCFCCPVGQGYGLTETSGAGTIAEVGDLSTGRVGAPVTCSEIRLTNWAEGGYTNCDQPCPRGEILIGGGNITMGYFKNEKKTKEDFTVIDGTRYFRSGDIGEIDSDGCLKIIDRKKDLVKLQTGEYVSLGKVETALKVSLLVDHICLYADSSKMYTVCLVVPNQKQLRLLAKEVGLSGTDFVSLCSNTIMQKEVLKVLTDIGRKAKLDKFELPQRLILCPEVWAPDTGLVTDAYKLKRKNIEQRYIAEITRMYASK